MSETTEGLSNEFVKWKEAFESKGLKVNLGKSRVMISGGIEKDSLSKSKVDQCGVCSLGIKASSVLCVQCEKCIHDRCARMKRVTVKFSRNFVCRNCKGNIAETVKQEETLCDEIETVKIFTYFGGRVSADGECEAAVTALTRCWWVKFSKCGRFHIKQKGAVYASYVSPAILYGSEACSLKERDI